jgi:hypothetical protein
MSWIAVTASHRQSQLAMLNSSAQWLVVMLHHISPNQVRADRFSVWTGSSDLTLIHSGVENHVTEFVVFSRIVLIISLPTLTASGNRGAKYCWIFSNRSRYASKAPKETQSDQACKISVLSYTASLARIGEKLGQTRPRLSLLEAGSSGRAAIRIGLHQQICKQNG